jgi:hypothetical protein
MVASVNDAVDGQKENSVWIGAKTSEPLQFLRPHVDERWRTSAFEPRRAGRSRARCARKFHALRLTRVAKLDSTREAQGNGGDFVAFRRCRLASDFDPLAGIYIAQAGTW